ncbi:MAG: pentapeptide repeat-containing protein [Pleurocapsa sp.]
MIIPGLHHIRLLFKKRLSRTEFKQKYDAGHRDFRYTILEDVDLSNYLSGIDVRYSDLRWVKNLPNVIENTDLTGVNLEGVNLQGINLSDSVLTDANLTAAQFNGANLEGLRLPYGVNLHQVSS